MRLRGGIITLDRRLDRVPQFDPRSRSFPIRTVVPSKVVRRTWRLDVRLDQGYEGACVGFSWAHELNAAPKRKKADAEAARSIYREAQKIDEWAGESYEGTSVLAGAKVVQQLGKIREYRWAFGLDDVLRALSHEGPVVLGVNWYSGMYEPDVEGAIHPHGDLVGGHAILARGVDPERETVLLSNSWGRDWGRRGDALISWDDLNQLLREDGEACCPIRG